MRKLTYETLVGSLTKSAAKSVRSRRRYCLAGNRGRPALSLMVVGPTIIDMVRFAGVLVACKARAC